MGRRRRRRGRGRGRRELAPSQKETASRGFSGGRANPLRKYRTALLGRAFVRPARPTEEASKESWPDGVGPRGFDLQITGSQAGFCLSNPGFVVSAHLELPLARPRRRRNGPIGLYGGIAASAGRASLDPLSRIDGPMQLVEPARDVGEGPVNEEGRLVRRRRRSSTFEGRLDPASSVSCTEAVASDLPFLRRQRENAPSPRPQRRKSNVSVRRDGPSSASTGSIGTRTLPARARSPRRRGGGWKA